MINESGYRIEQLRTENLVDLNRLFKAVYGTEPAENYFKKKYDTLYTGVSCVGYLAYDIQDEPCGFYGVIPCFLSYRKTKILIAQSADTMTHPNHRQKGLFNLLMEKTITLCGEQGIQLLYGFPNQNSLYGFRKANWQVTENLDCFVIKIKGSFYVRVLKKFVVFKNIYSRLAASLLKPLAIDKLGLPNLAADEGFDVLLRDEAYLKYKSYSSTSVLRFGKSLVWVKLQNGLFIGDIIVDDKDFDMTINQLKKLAYQLGLNQLVFQSNPGTKLHSLFTARYASFPSFPTIFYPIADNITINKIKFTFADIDIF